MCCPLTTSILYLLTHPDHMTTNFFVLQVKVTPLRPLRHERLNNALARLFCNVLDDEEEHASVFEERAGIEEDEEAANIRSPHDINMVSSRLVSCF